MTHRHRLWCGLVVIGSCLVASNAFAQTAVVAGSVHDETGAALPGVSVELRPAAGPPLLAVTDALGAFRFAQVTAGLYQAAFTLINFASTRREIDVAASGSVRLEGGYRLDRHLKVAVDVFNLLDGRASDIDYYYTSRLVNEPAGGVNDIHLHPALPRTARVNLIVGF